MAKTFVNADTGEAFRQLDGVETMAATEASISTANIRAAEALNLPSMHDLPGFNVFKHDEPIALIGGGPSIRETVDELREFPVTIACGSAHDWAVQNGIKPTYCAIADPDPIMAAYVRNPCPETMYLVATQCDKSVFEALRGQKMAAWHILNESHADYVKETGISRYPGVGGGCTIGLRSISIAMMFGYRNIHFFGFDSCLDMTDDAHHAYDYATDQEETGDVYALKIGQGLPGDRTYRVSGYMLAQALHFKSFWTQYDGYFVPTFHGSGLLHDLWCTIKETSRQPQEIAA